MYGNLFLIHNIKLNQSSFAECLPLSCNRVSAPHRLIEWKNVRRIQYNFLTQYYYHPCFARCENHPSPTDITITNNIYICCSVVWNSKKSSTKTTFRLRERTRTIIYFSQIWSKQLSSNSFFFYLFSMGNLDLLDRL